MNMTRDLRTEYHGRRNNLAPKCWEAQIHGDDNESRLGAGVPRPHQQEPATPPTTHHTQGAYRKQRRHNHTTPPPQHNPHTKVITNRTNCYVSPQEKQNLVHSNSKQFTQRVGTLKLWEKPNSSHNEQHFGDWGEKNIINCKKPLEPDTMWAAICIDRSGWA